MRYLFIYLFFFSSILYSIFSVSTHLTVYNIVFQQLYKADYEDMKIRSYFPQTVTPEFEALRKLQKCNDVSMKILDLPTWFFCTLIFHIFILSDCF